jgi:hypothetical protein
MDQAHNMGMKYIFLLFLENISENKVYKILSKNSANYLQFFMQRAGNLVEEVYYDLVLSNTAHKQQQMVVQEMVIQSRHLVALGFRNLQVMILFQQNLKDLVKF